MRISLLNLFFIAVAGYFIWQICRVIVLPIQGQQVWLVGIGILFFSLIIFLIWKIFKGIPIGMDGID